MLKFDAAAFVSAVNNLAVPLGLLQDFTTQSSFAEFYTSSFPVFAIGHQVPQSDVNKVVDIANEQACTELSFEAAELKDMGYAAAIPRPWRLPKEDSLDAVGWYQNAFDKIGSTGDTANPQWYPLGFLGITSPDWRIKGVVLVFYDALYGQSSNQEVSVNAHRLNPQLIGPTVICLRQGDNDYENIKKRSAIEEM
jgi:hypothetical protein